MARPYLRTMNPMPPPVVSPPMPTEWVSPVESARPWALAGPARSPEVAPAWTRAIRVCGVDADRASCATGRRRRRRRPRCGARGYGHRCAPQAGGRRHERSEPLPRHPARSPHARSPSGRRSTMMLTTLRAASKSALSVMISSPASRARNAAIRLRAETTLRMRVVGRSVVVMQDSLYRFHRPAGLAPGSNRVGRAAVMMLLQQPAAVSKRYG